MRQIQINLIYLAAGYAKRFGSNKLLTDYQGMPLFVQGLMTADGFRAALMDMEEADMQIRADLIVVTSHAQIERWCREHDILCVHHETACNTGMASTIRRGIDFCESREKTASYSPDETEYYDMFFAADQPRLNAALLCRFTQAFLRQKLPIGALEYRGILQNPGIFAAGFRSELKQLVKEQGGKVVRQNHADEVYHYPAADGMMFFDIDTKEDLARHLSAGTSQSRQGNAAVPESE